MSTKNFSIAAVSLLLLFSLFVFQSCSKDNISDNEPHYFDGITDLKALAGDKLVKNTDKSGILEIDGLSYEGDFYTFNDNTEIFDISTEEGEKKTLPYWTGTSSMEDGAVYCFGEATNCMYEEFEDGIVIVFK